MFSFEGIRRSRIRGLFEKAQDSGFRKHATFAPTSTLEGEQLRFPPSNVRLASLTAPCLPFSDAQTRPATKGAHPLGIPTDLGQLSRPQISQNRFGFRLRSPHLSGEEPCPLLLQTVFSPTALRLYAEKDEEGMALKIRLERRNFPLFLTL